MLAFIAAGAADKAAVKPFWDQPYFSGKHPLAALVGELGSHIHLNVRPKSAVRTKAGHNAALVRLRSLRIWRMP
jgi:hypothetical protein